MLETLKKYQAWRTNTDGILLRETDLTAKGISASLDWAIAQLSGNNDDLTVAYMSGYHDAKVKFSKIAMDAPITAGMQDSDDAKALAIHINSLIKRG